MQKYIFSNIWGNIEYKINKYICPIDFENDQNECRKAQSILKMAKMSVAGHF